MEGLQEHQVDSAKNASQRALEDEKKKIKPEDETITLTVHNANSEGIDASATLGSTSVSTEAIKKEAAPTPACPPAEVNVDDEINAFLTEVQDSDIEYEINRILRCNRWNALEILNVDSNAYLPDINRAYRTISLKIHPDKLNTERRQKMKPQAVEAFNRLNEAKTELTDTNRRDAFMILVGEARQQIITQNEQKRRKALNDELNRLNKLSILTAKDAKRRTEIAEQMKSLDGTKEPDFEVRVRRGLTEKLIEREWVRRQRLKRASELEIESERAEEARTKARLDAEEAKKSGEIDRQREARAKYWRQFQNGSNRGKRFR